MAPTITTITLNWHADAGHAWLQAPATLLDAVGLARKDFTKFSYVSSSGSMYLEEDCDAPKLLDALKAKDIHVEYKEHHYMRHAPCKRFPKNTEGEWSPST